MVTVPLRLTVVVEYDANPGDYGLTADGGELAPVDMARIDEINVADDPGVILDLMESYTSTVTVAPAT